MSVFFEGGYYLLYGDATQILKEIPLTRNQTLWSNYNECCPGKLGANGHQVLLPSGFDSQS
jgi:hypothetical protein